MIFTSDWVSQHVEGWKRLTASMVGQPCNLLEIGVFEGRSTRWWLDNVLTHPNSRITCIEPWAAEAPRHRHVFYANVEDRLPQITVYQDYSHRVLGRLIPGFDLAYIDGDHEALSVLRDGLMVLPLMKPGGIIIFDDYEMDQRFCWNEDGVPPKQGIDAFLAIAGSRIEVVHREYQVAVRVKP